jgi:hypothetical protein
MTNSTQPLTVSIITVSNRDDVDGSFTKHLHSVYASLDGARAKLKAIQAGYANEDEWRAKTPLSGSDALSIDLLVGDFYQCKTFYSITTTALMN